MELRIEKLGAGDDGIAHDSTGKTVFVPLTAPGDLVETKIIDSHPRFDRARLVRVIEPGPARVDAPCPWFGVCGGCGWQHLSAALQADTKQLMVSDALRRIGKLNIRSEYVHTDPSLPELRQNPDARIPEPKAASLTKAGIIPADANRLCEPKGVPAKLAPSNLTHYRNKIELLAGQSNNGKLTLGYRRRGSHEIVPIDRCLLLDDRARDIIKALTGALRFLSGSRELPLTRVGIRCAANTPDLEIALHTEASSFPRAQAARTLSAAVPAMTGLVRVVHNTRRGRTAPSAVEVLRGPGRWHERLTREDFYVSAPSFFQVNSPGAEILTQLVCDFLAPDGTDTVLDLYSGVGTFSLPLARGAREVIAIESAAPAIRDLRHHIQATGLPICAIGGDAAREITQVAHADLVVIDPPRAGMEEAGLDALTSLHPRKIAYVSCDPATLARDLARFERRGYLTQRVTPVDLFPQTHHIECVAELVQNDSHPKAKHQ